jgi:ABC-type antimicrobial peptide transport system permease subunit
MFSSAVVVPAQYKANLREAFPKGTSLLSMGSPEKTVGMQEAGVDYISFMYNGITHNASLKNGSSILDNLLGEAQLFKNVFNKTSYMSRLDGLCVSGRMWSEDDNGVKNQIWLSKPAAAALQASVGHEVELTGRAADVRLAVIGIYEENAEEDNTPAFVISYGTAYAILDGVGEGTFFLEIYDVTRIARVVNELDKRGIDWFDMSGTVDNVNAIASSETLFWVLTVILLIIGAFAAANVLAMLVKVREKTYGLYKMLGAETNYIMNLAFSALSFLLTFSAVFGIFFSVLINGYFDGIALDLFNADFKIGLVWYAPVAVIAINSLFLLLRYFRTKRRLDKISPLIVLTEET